jgi:predicted nucleic acid-binding Zn ribbon protein
MAALRRVLNRWSAKLKGSFTDMAALRRVLNRWSAKLKGSFTDMAALRRVLNRWSAKLKGFFTSFRMTGNLRENVEGSSGDLKKIFPFNKHPIKSPLLPSL